MITVGVKLLLLAFSALTLLAFVVLFIAAESTDRYFAWTIKPAATAAFLGAAYAAGCVLVVLSLRRGVWSAVRIPYLTVLAFVVLTLAATLAHLDKLHFNRPEVLPRFAAWFWMAVYVVVPVVMVVLLLRAPARGAGPAGGRGRIGIPGPVAVVLAVQGVVFVVVGVALFVEPTAEQLLWPWPLTPLTSRVVAAWLIAFGLGAALALRTRDLTRLDVPATAYAVLAVLELVALARFAAVVRWGSAATWMYVVLLASILVSAAYALVRLRRWRSETAVRGRPSAARPRLPSSGP